jgi:hypothetical protein
MENSRSIPAIIADLLEQASTLLQTEASLARAELSENLESIGAGLAMLVVGAALLIPGLVVLLQGCAAAVTAAGLPDYWSLAIFGGGVFVLGLIFMSVGRSRMKLSNLKPRKTMDELDRDVALAKQQMRGTIHAKTQRAA